jgi:AcrR family transcriptional regulator
MCESRDSTVFIMNEELKDSEREAIVEAANECFGVHGFQPTTTEKICEVAGVDRQTFEQYFDTKTDVFRVLYDRNAEGATRRLAEALMAPTDREERIRGAVRSIVDYLLDDRRRARIQCIESHRVGGEFAKHQNSTLHDFADMLASGSRLMGGIPLTEAQVRLGAVAFIMATDTVIAEHLRHPDAVSRTDCIQTLSYLFRKAAGF